MTAAPASYAVNFIRALRPTQWTKNAVVGAAFVFALGDRNRIVPLELADLWFRVLPAVALFCMASSGVYLLNDLRDADADRNHPVKRNRPVAAGLISKTHAFIVSVLLLGTSLALAVLLSRPYAKVLGAYLVLQFAYTLWLKRVSLLDVIVIASGFVLRAMAGAVVLVGVTISPWLLLCTFLLALFLGFCKRRHEKGQVDEQGDNQQRVSLEHYDRQLLDMLIAISAAATTVCYSIYTLWPDTVEKFGTHALGFTIPFVIFGIFRYLDLAYRQGRGEQPDRVLLSDLPLILNIIGYALAVLAILFLQPPPS